MLNISFITWSPLFAKQRGDKGVSMYEIIEIDCHGQVGEYKVKTGRKEKLVSHLDKRKFYNPKMSIH
jgi:hypothetical protein